MSAWVLVMPLHREAVLGRSRLVGREDGCGFRYTGLRGSDFWRLGLSPQVTRECGEGTRYSALAEISPGPRTEVWTQNAGGGLDGQPGAGHPQELRLGDPLVLPLLTSHLLFL